MREKIKKRIGLVAFAVFFMVVIFAGVSKTTNADSLNVDISTVKSNYNLGKNNAGEITVVAKQISETTTGSSISLVKSDVSDEGLVLVGTVVNLSKTTTGGAIIYTTNGTDPKIDTGIVYKDAIVIEDDVTIKACVYKENTYGDTVKFDYEVFKVEQVQTSLPSCTLTTSSSIELSTSTTGAAIYYEIEELDFSNTTTPQAIQYSGPIKIESSKKITAYAVKEGYKDSIKSEFTYTMENQIIIQREVDEEVIAGEFTTFDMKAKNLLTELKSVSLVFAVYDEKDRMIDYIYVSEVLKQGETTEIHSGLRITNEGRYIKIYAIDNLNGLVPLSNTIKIPVKSKE